MSYFSYHAKAKMLIRSGELEKFEIVEDWRGIKPALVLFFRSNPPMPIREHKFFEYLTLIDKIEKEKDNKKDERRN